MRRFRVVFAREARLHVQTRVELRAAIRQLRSAPNASTAYEVSPVPRTRRLLLPRTRHHIYFIVDEAAGIVSVRAVWHASRGAGPL